jgi:hypothetical protein
MGLPVADYKVAKRNVFFDSATVNSAIALLYNQVVYQPNPLFPFHPQYQITTYINWIQIQT